MNQVILVSQEFISVLWIIDFLHPYETLWKHWFSFFPNWKQMRQKSAFSIVDHYYTVFILFYTN